MHMNFGIPMSEEFLSPSVEMIIVNYEQKSVATSKLEIFMCSI